MVFPCFHRSNPPKTRPSQPRLRADNARGQIRRGGDRGGGTSHLRDFMGIPLGKPWENHGKMMVEWDCTGSCYGSSWIIMDIYILYQELGEFVMDHGYP